MGMPTEPRQAMINMMYLVLTAMLAMNISAETLNAFFTVDKGIQKTTQNLNNSLDFIVDGFKKRAENDVNAAPFYEKAVEAQQIAAALTVSIDELKDSLINESGYEIDEKTGDLILLNPSDTHVPTLMLVNEGYGTELKEQIQSARQSFLALYDEEDRPQKASLLYLNADDPKPAIDSKIQTWESFNFNEVPMVAALTLLSKIQNDAKNCEADVIEYLRHKVNLQYDPVDRMTARVIPNRKYLTIGERYQADIMVTASSSSLAPQVYIGQFDNNVIKRTNGKLPLEVLAEEIPLRSGYRTVADEKDGIATFSSTVNNKGQIRYQGVVAVKNPQTGITKYFPFEEDYLVGESKAVIAAKKLNVLYVGLQNPLDISVPGYNASQISPVIEGEGNKLILQEDGSYLAQVTANQKEVNIKVNGNIDGQIRQLGQTTFNVKRVPNPEVNFMGSNGGPIARNLAQQGLGLIASNTSFVYNVKYEILSFEMSVSTNNQIAQTQCTGNRLCERAKNLLRNVQRGSRIYFDNIRIKYPDGRVLSQNISFKVS